MSRLNRFKHALLSGYIALGANTLYTLASLPLAQAYLSKAEFGLWAIVTPIAGYVALIDLGMSGSVARILIDYKDDRADGRYGSTLLTSVLVGLVQGGLVLIVGMALALIGSGLLRVPHDLTRQFFWLVVGQSVLQAIAFLFRSLQLVLTAHQRFDVINHAQTVLFGVNYLSMWAGFAWGFGVYSALWSQAVVLLLTIAANAWWCARLKLLPRAGEWGRPTRERFKEVFSYGTDVFLFTVGAQMVNATQMLVVTPFLGIEAAGVWFACTRTFTVVYQLVYRIFDFSSIALAELYVRGEHAKFLDRFRSVTVVTTSVAVVGAVMFALYNQPFVAVWSKAGYGWSPLNDALLGVWLVLMSVQRCHTGILGVKKQLKTVKYVYFAEGCLFIALASVSARSLGYAGVIGSSILATSALSFTYGLRRTRIDFQLTWKEMLGWLQPAALVAAPLILWALGMAYLLPNHRPILQFAAGGLATGTVGAVLLLRWGLDRAMQQLVRDKLPGCLQWLVDR